MNTKQSIHIGDEEFGEIYHAAAWVAVSDGHSVDVIGDETKWRNSANFLNHIKEGAAKISLNIPKETSGPGSTADWFNNHKHDRLPQIVSEKIGNLIDNVVTHGRIDDLTEKFKSTEPSCFLWVRHGKYKPERNLTAHAFEQLKCILSEAGIRPILIGSSAPYAIKGDGNLIEFYNDKLLEYNPLTQLALLDKIRVSGSVKFSIGMKSGGMDGLAFARQFPTYYITNQATNGRMDKVGSVFPAFRKILVDYKEKFMAFSPLEMDIVFTAIS